MLKKKHDLKWSEEANNDFKDTQKELCHALVLTSLDYGEEFQLFSTKKGMAKRETQKTR